MAMKAIAFTEQGGVDVLKYQEVAEPTLGPDEILVKVKACAVNYLDIHARRDRPEIKQKLEATGAPHISGSDIAGEIADISGTHLNSQSVIVCSLHHVFPAVYVATVSMVTKISVIRSNYSDFKLMADTQRLSRHQPRMRLG